MIIGDCRSDSIIYKHSRKCIRSLTAYTFLVDDVQKFFVCWLRDGILKMETNVRTKHFVYWEKVFHSECAVNNEKVCGPFYFQKSTIRDISYLVTARNGYLCNLKSSWKNCLITSDIEQETFSTLTSSSGACWNQCLLQRWNGLGKWWWWEITVLIIWSIPIWFLFV